METVEARQSIDELLLPFVQATDERDSQRLLTHLVSDHAQPIINNIIRNKLHLPLGRLSGTRLSDDAEEISSEILVQLLSRLAELKEQPDDKYINNFRSYVAAITYSAWHEHLRAKYPQRHALKNKLRYLLTHRPGFAVWENERAYLCGLARWEGQKNTPAGARRIQELSGGPQSAERAGLSSDDLQRLDLASLVSAVFKYVGSCADLDDLVNLIAAWTAIKDHADAQSTKEDDDEDLFERMPDPRPTADIELQRRVYLERLWVEICQLRPQQRAALLLNLKDKDGGDVVSVFPIAGIATLSEIADALAMHPERLAALWNDLPLDDLTIAKHLDITRQQVINLRKSARERLARRMRAF